MKLENLIIGGFASFVEDGTVVGTPGNTVGVGFFPEATADLAAWQSLGCVLDATPDSKVETDTVYCPLPSGGYGIQETNNAVQDALKISLQYHSELIHRLVWGLKNKIVNGVAQAPFAQKDRAIRGWLNFQARAQDGNDRIVAALYGEIRLDAAPKWSKDPTKPAIRFVNIYSSIAAVEPLAIV